MEKNETLDLLYRQILCIENVFDIKCCSKLKQLLISFYQGNNENIEKLELLGDKKISLVLVEWLIELFPNEDEGLISKRLNYLSSSEVMADITFRRRLFFHDNNKKCADFLEILIGFLYIEHFDITKKIKNIWRPYLKIYNEDDFNPKGSLQEMLASRNNKLKYEIDNLYNWFYVRCIISDLKEQYIFKGDGKSIKLAQSIAARKALDFLKSNRRLPYLLPFKFLIGPKWYLDTLNSKVRKKYLLIEKNISIFPSTLKISKNYRKLFLGIID